MRILFAGRYWTLENYLKLRILTLEKILENPEEIPGPGSLEEKRRAIIGAHDEIIALHRLIQGRPAFTPEEVARVPEEYKKA